MIITYLILRLLPQKIRNEANFPILAAALFLFGALELFIYYLLLTGSFE